MMGFSILEEEEERDGKQKRGQEEMRAFFEKLIQNEEAERECDVVR